MKLELTDQQLQIIIAGLGELPFKFANPVLFELQKQVDQQKDKDQNADVSSGA